MRNALFPPLLMLAALPAAAGAVPHRRAPTLTTHVVALSAHPGTALDTEARSLAARDIADSVSHGEQPLVLVGSATLATRHGAPRALFVQLQSASLCGSAGCETSVYLPAHGSWTKVLDSVSGPVAVLAASHGGMRDLVVGEHDHWIWSGSAYADTMQAPALTGLKRSVERHQAAVAADGGVSPPPRTP